MRGKIRVSPAESRARYYWIGGAIAVVALSVLFAARMNHSTSPYLSIVLRTEFAGTYVNRNHLREQLPGAKPWVEEAWDLVYQEKLPGVRTDLDVIRLYPREELANIAYNIKITPKVLGAMFLSFDHPVVMLTAFVLYLVSFIVWPGKDGRFRRWQSIPRETSELLAVWAAATCLIVAVIIPLYISSRHYVQLIPVEIILTTFILRMVMGKFLTFLRLTRK